MSGKILRYIAYAFIAAICIAILTGNMGGARDATNNYQKIMRGGN